jgi:polysaccharide export outer membrane protein
MPKRFHIMPRLMAMTLAGAACVQCPASRAEAAMREDATPSDASAEPTAYRFGSGDRLRIRVYNDDAISGEYQVDSAGNLSLQLLGPVKAAGLSLPELVGLIEQRLKNEGFMVAPKVAIDVLNYRPFYVLGEVNRPGSYPYVAGMTVLNAIAMAGGYTPRAKQSAIKVLRGEDQEKRKVAPNAVVLPGDIVKVEERFF